MVTLKEFKDIIKKYKEPFDYLISYVEGGKEIYDIRSQELKQVLFAEILKEEIVPSGASCKVEVKGEEVKKNISIADSQTENSSKNQIFPVDSSVFSQQSFLVEFPNNSLNGPLPIRPTYDKEGNQIIGQDNIRKEVERRRAEWSQQEKEGKLQTERKENYQKVGDISVYEYIEYTKKT